MALQDYFVWGSGGQKKTPDQIARERKIAEAMIASGVDTSPVGHWTQGAARMANALVGNIKQGRADTAEKAGIEGATNKFNSLDLAKILSGGQAAYPSSIAAGASPTSAAATGTVPQGKFNFGDNADALRNGIVETAQAIGADPVDLATAISYETAGTFDPTKAGPRTQYGQHRGLIQFGEPQAEKYGVDWNNPLASQLGSNGAVANYFRSSGFKPGMSGLDLYSTINAGSPGRYSASDANNGGAPGDVRDKWENQMAGHRQKALALLGGGASAAPVQVASLDPTIGMGQAYAPQSQPAQSTAADAINMIAPTEPQGISQDQFNSRFSGAQEAQPVQPQAMQQPDPMPTGALPQAPQSQFSDRAIQQHDAMFGGALAPAGNAPQQAPAGQGYFPDAPAMGSYASMAPQSQQGGNQLQELMAAASDPFLNDSQRGMINMALQQQLQNSDPMRQMQMQKAQLEIDALRAKPTTKYGFTTLPDGTVLRTNEAQGSVEPVFNSGTKPTTDIQNFEYARQNGFTGSFDQYQQMVKKAGANSTNVSVGEGDKFYEALDKKNAETFSSLSDTGVQARSKLAQIDRLRGLMAASPTGATAALKLAAGEYGIKTDRLDDLQAAQALINELVPQQRQPGSGPMSDADLALFKQSLPRIINTPDGNNLILDTMTGITQYQIQMGDIADQVANREITAAQGRELIKNLKNPLEGFRKSSKDIGTGGNRTSSGVQWSIEP